eukprot:scaffold108073_cov33-Phaeocystis_antarctica.AAC.1
MARAGMSDEEMTAFLKETFCVDSTFTAADLFNVAKEMNDDATRDAGCPIRPFTEQTKPRREISETVMTDLMRRPSLGLPAGVN